MKLGYRAYYNVFPSSTLRYEFRPEKPLSGASCLIRNCLGVPLDMRKDIREVCAIFTPENSRGQGLATGLMSSLCREADAGNKTLLLTIDEPEREKLTAFYAKFGFAVIDDKQFFMMIRNPHAAEVVLNVG